MPLVVLGLAARAIDLLVERLGQVGDDEAAVGALRPGLDAGDDAALDLAAWRHSGTRHSADLLGLAGQPSMRLLGE